MFQRSRRLLFLILGIFSLILGFIGVALPLLPTTPFLILSAFLFSNSSQKLHSWLLNHRIFGPTINDWEKHKVIRPRAKVIATIMIVSLFSYTLIFVNVHIYIKFFTALVGLGVIYFILSRASYSKVEVCENPKV